MFKRRAVILKRIAVFLFNLIWSIGIINDILKLEYTPHGYFKDMA